MKNQFCLNQEKVFNRPDWHVRQKSEWSLWHDPQLPVIDVVCRDSSQVGWVLGYPIDTDRCLLCPPQIRLSCDSEADLAPQVIEDTLRGLGGRFAMLILTDRCKCFHPDASGALSILYSLGTRQAASTLELFSNLTPSSEPLWPKIQPLKEQSGTWYPMGMTPLKDVRVLLPNHFLDLDVWQVKRSWAAESVCRLQDADKATPTIQQIVNLVQCVIAAVDEQYPITMNLTSGRDSRMLLACIKEVATKYEFHTLPHHQESDVIIANVLAKAFDLKLHVADYPSPDRVVLQGLAGEVGRSFYWRAGDSEQTKLSGKDLLARMNQETSEQAIIDLADAWFEPLKVLSPFLILDLLYIELRLGCAMGPAMYSFDKTTQFQMYPLNHRRVFELMLTLPTTYRSNQYLFRDICGMCWPSLLMMPLNKAHFTGLEKYRKLAQYVQLRSNLTTKERQAIWSVITRDRSIPRVVWDDICSIFRKVVKWW